MADRILLLAIGGRGARYSVWFERFIRVQWIPSLHRFQGNGWHFYLLKFRFTRSSRRVPQTTPEGTKT